MLPHFCNTKSLAHYITPNSIYLITPHARTARHWIVSMLQLIPSCSISRIDHISLFIRPGRPMLDETLFPPPGLLTEGFGQPFAFLCPFIHSASAWMPGAMLRLGNIWTSSALSCLDSSRGQTPAVFVCCCSWDTWLFSREASTILCCLDEVVKYKELWSSGLANSLSWQLYSPVFKSHLCYNKRDILIHNLSKEGRCYWLWPP